MMEGDTSPTPCGSPNNLHVHLSSCYVRLPLLPPCTPARLPQGCPTVKWLPDLFVCSRGWGRCMWRMHRVCGQWRHWESREGRVVVFWHRIPRPFHFFPPSFLWFYGLLTGSRLSSGYKRGSLADLLQRFLQWLQEKRDLQQGWTG